MEKVSLCITVKNEERSIHALLRSIETQTMLPDEVIIVDGGSTDRTYNILKDWRVKCRKIVALARGNRSVGRNLAISLARNELIAITDAGCALEQTWLQEIIKPFSRGVDVVAGYYAPNAVTSFQRAAAAYMLVMPENADENTFLPATRSMAIKKSVWEKVGRFNVDNSQSEDYQFARKLRKNRAKIVFQRSAVVYWQPPRTWKTFLRQIYLFALGDMSHRAIRPKVLFIFARYVTFLVLLFKVPLAFLALMSVYALWSIAKNYRYVCGVSAIPLLPMMQISTDIVVMAGSLTGLFKRKV